MRVWNKIGVGLKLSSTVLKKVQEFENFVRAENFRILNYDYLIWESYGHTFDFLLKLFFLGYSTEKSKTVFFKLESPSRFLYINLKWRGKLQRNWVFVTNSTFLISISLLPNVVDLWYFKLWILSDLII